MSVSGRFVSGLRHVGIAVPDYDAALKFYSDVWRLERVTANDEVAYFGTPADPEHYILRVRKDSHKRLDLVAFSSPGRDRVDALADHLLSAGVRLDREPAPLATPGGGYGLRFFDLDGRLIEVSAEVAPRSFRPLEPRESVPGRLSHVVLNTTDAPATVAFYEKHLGMRVSDWLADFMCFMRANNQHHILAISAGPHTSLNHISFEMRGIDEQMRGAGRLIRAGYKPVWGPGRHGAGDNVFTYFRDPAGNVVEYTTEMETIEDESSWRPRRFETTPEAQDQWGTGGRVTDAMIPAMFNEPDPGVWQSCPV